MHQCQSFVCPQVSVWELQLSFKKLEHKISTNILQGLNLTFITSLYNRGLCLELCRLEINKTTFLTRWGIYAKKYYTLLSKARIAPHICLHLIEFVLFHINSFQRTDRFYILFLESSSFCLLTLSYVNMLENGIMLICWKMESINS